MSSPFGPIQSPNRTPQSVTFNALGGEQFDAINVAASTPLASVVAAATIALHQDVKVSHVAVTSNTLSGSPAIQIVLGGGAPGAVGEENEVASNGTIVFAAPVSASNALISSYNGAQILYPEEPDAIYPQGKVLTLRTLSGAGDTATGLRIAVGLIPYDLKPTPTLEAFTPQDY